MPSKSEKQAKFMRAVANNPKFAKKAGVSQKVGKEFEKMDKKMKKYAKGGSVSSRADGCAKKGKTHTKMVAMAKGGKMKGCK